MLTKLAQSLHYYSSSTPGRFVKSGVHISKDFKSSTAPISEKLVEVEKLAALADAERINQIATNVREIEQ